MSKELVRVTVEDGVATIRVDNPPVNALSPGVPEGIASAMKISTTNPNVQAIVLIGAGRTFVAGADIKELEAAAWGNGAGGPDLDRLLRDIEDCSKPVVMAIHGTALGGGLELAMAGHFRIAVRDASMGQPEVNLGIIPGAQGSQRLPRLVGVEKAIDMCVSGKPLKAPDALAAGILDAIVEGDLALEAATFARQLAARSGPFPKTSEKNDKLTTGNLSELLSAGRQPAKKTRERHYDQWIYLGQDKNERADAREQIGAPILVRRLAHHVAARQNQTNGERRKPPFDRAADRRILGALPELHDEIDEQPRRRHHRGCGENGTQNSHQLTPGTQSRLVADQRDNQNARTGRGLGNRENVRELAVVEPMVVVDGLVVHFRQNRIAAANRQQGERTKQEKDLEQGSRAHGFFVLGHPQTRLSGARRARLEADASARRHS